MNCNQCGKPIDKTKKITSEFCSRQCKDKHWQIVRKLDRKIDRVVQIIVDLERMKRKQELTEGQYNSAINIIQRTLDRVK